MKDALTLATRLSSIGVGVATVMAAACSSGSPVAPTAFRAPEVDRAPSLAVQEAAGPAANGPAVGARVYRETQLCSLPSIAADGTPFPLEDVRCDVQLVLTANGRDLATGFIKASVPNDSGGVFHVPLGAARRPCRIEIDSDGDGTPDLVRETLRYVLTLAVSGRIVLSCHFLES